MNRLHLLPTVAALALAACASVPDRNVLLDDAHRIVAQAAASGEVNRYAQTELMRAREALARADLAWSDKRGDADVNHLAYLAAQHGHLTLNLAAQRAMDARIETAGAERERLRADVRTRQAQQAEQSAQIAQAQADSARAQAQFAQTQAQNAQAAAAAQTERADRLQRELQALAAKPTDHGMVLVLQDVLFDVGQASLKPGAYAKLDQIAAVLKSYPERRVLVEGFTDSVGSHDSNLALSVARAEAVRSALLSRGISPDRIEARGHGEARPVAGNDTQAGRQQNRRVEVVFSDERGRFASLN
ncbi:OmpA family protein [Piscinibacter sp. XHJ-5]|uniref:OmpA family protein n=1 Tax=Piscinibacter sp. XHJ-5 TaxID=3037797 RepID=UPI0024529ACD|nr:OmpA family protein [Piscinibacter sp. XHJ-5]